jgi:hypothetical protein
MQPRLPSRLAGRTASILGRRGLILGRKLDADTVDTVALISRRRIALTLEDVAQVAAAVGAHNLGALHAQRVVDVALDGAGQAVKIGRPAAARLELVRCLVERRLAAGAAVDALVGKVLVVLAGKGTLGALFAEDTELF